MKKSSMEDIRSFAGKLTEIRQRVDDFYEEEEAFMHSLRERDEDGDVIGESIFTANKLNDISNRIGDAIDEISGLIELGSSEYLEEE